MRGCPYKNNKGGGVKFPKILMESRLGPLFFRKYKSLILNGLLVNNIIVNIIAVL